MTRQSRKIANASSVLRCGSRYTISKAQAILHWQPKTSLRDGLMKVVVYFERLLSGQEAHA